MRRRSGGRAVGRSVRYAPFLVVGLGACLALVACGSSDRPTARPPARSIIESATPIWGAGHGLVLADTPMADIGGLSVVSDAVRLADGRIVVADASPVALRYYAADGRHLYDAGGAEDGPDALKGIAHLSVGRADTVAAYDFARSALVLFDPNGARAGTVLVHPELTPRGANGLLPRGLVADGRYLLQADETKYPFPGAAGAIISDSTRLYWFARGGTLTDSSARLFEGESFGFPAKGTQGLVTLLPLARPLGATLRVASGASGTWIGDGTAWELRHLDAHGQVDRTLRLTRALAPLTPEFKASFVARFRARRLGTDPRGLDRQFAAAIDQSPFPAQLPAFNDIIVGADSVLWVEHSGLLEGQRGDGTLDWTLFGPDGRWLGDLTMPPYFRPTAAGHGWLLGVLSAPEGPMRVRLYSLQER